MEIYHPHTKVDTMQVVHRFAELHVLVRELCHTFKVRAYNATGWGPLSVASSNVTPT